MPDYNKLTNLAKDCGFTNYAPLDIATLHFMEEVRDMCNPGKCDRYDTSWSCPPACASLEEMRRRVLSYDAGLLVQTIGQIEDSYDWDGIMETGTRHKINFGHMYDELRKDNPSVLAMGAGACSLCETCAYPDSPCRYPDKASASMEACGLFVSKVCTDNGLAYNYGRDKIAFTSCFLV